jgi:Uma2 family endonuclease
MSQSSATPNPPPFDEREEHMTVEILDGLKLMSPRPALPHTLVATALGAVLHQRFHRKFGGPPDRPGGWVVLVEPELHFGETIIIPDIAAWRRDRCPRPDFRGAATHVAPDWVCEVLSDSTEKTDRQYKVPIYHRHNVAHMWLVQPLVQTIELYRWSEEGYVLLPNEFENQRLRAAPFDAIEIPLEEIWPDYDELGV